ncbi:hypothetical protein N0B16_03910 [Chryseobacterium sp. GMJ5]|uniref:Trimeric autotransporter adhesin YadA-like head domain-containing protein n=1 Tax=Chryseobacterium gilvum TaxID=2976534 RepID=A0ABT2VVE0_9FLAO|nr:hypothetical protein [Chryseobacterium gilvum]MCU7613574.1 hypothetical protein [Chryseobacterium gilvum]
MKRILVLSVLIFLSLKPNSLLAQVGIGTTTPHDSSILHLKSSNKGLLLPSVAITSATDTATIVSPATGLLIWVDGTGGLTPAGLYYWNNSQWNFISSSGAGINAATAWNTNATNPGTSSGASTALSLGTSTYDDLVFKINNTIAGRLGTNGSVLFGTGTTSFQNGVAIGTNAAANNNESIAVGSNSSAAGFQSLALGYTAKTNSNNETALGNNAQTNGQNSTALGTAANAAGQNSTAIGYGASTSQANAIILGNTVANVGIGTSTPNISAKIDVNGQYKLGDKGSLHKNQISFEVWPSVSINNLQSGRTATVNFTIPAGFQPNSTRATILVSPANDFAGILEFGINNPRMTSTSNMTINLTNISNGNASLFSGHFYVTINEF